MKLKAKYLLFIAVLFIGASYSSNDRPVDSLTELLKKTTTNGTARVDLLNAIAEKLMEDDHQRSLVSAYEALGLAKKIGYKKGIYSSNYLLGKLHTNYTLSFGTAIAYFTEAAKASDKNNWFEHLDLLTQMAFIHKRQGDFEKASNYYLLAIELATKHNETKKISNLYGYLSEVYEAEGNEQEAMECLQKILEIEKRTNYKNTEPAAFIAIAHYYELQKQFGPAESYLLDAQRVFETTGNHRWESYTNYLLAKLNLQKKDHKAGINYAKNGLELAKKFQLIKEEGDNHYILAILYDAANDHKNAYLHHKALKQIDDSIFNMNRVKEMSHAMAIYGTAVKEEQLAKLEAEKKLSESQLYRTQILAGSIFVLLVLSMVLAIVFYKNYKVKRNINKELANRIELRKLKLDEIITQLSKEVDEHSQTKAKLEVINAELSNFMQRSSHDLRSPLSSIVGLTDLAKGSMSEKERMDYLSLISQSTKRLEIFIDELTQATKVTHGNVVVSLVNLYDHVKQITDDLKNSKNFSGVRIIIRIDKDIDINTDKNLLKTVLHNLIENAAKYKSAEGNNPYVCINAENIESLLMISVSDNGLGIAMEHQAKIFDMFYRANNTTEGSGLGLYLVKKSVIKLGGKIRLISKEDEGTTIEISIPDLVNRHMQGVLLT